MIKVLSAILLVAFSISCNTRVEENTFDNKQEAINCNEKALKLKKQNISKSNNDSILNETIVIFEKAISFDSTFKSPYINKTNSLIALKEYGQAIKWIDTTKKRFPDNYEIVILQGFLFEKIGKSDSAIAIYNGVKNSFINNLYETSNEIANQLKIIEIDYYISKDKDSAIIKANNMLIKYPKNKEILEMIELLRIIDITKFINEEI